VTDTHDENVVIANDGDSDLVVTLSLPSSPSWLSIGGLATVTISESDDYTFALTFDPNGLSIGTYTTTLQIDHNDPPQTLGQDSVTITFEIIEGVYNLDDSAADATAYFSVTGTTTSTATISNTGTGTSKHL